MKRVRKLFLLSILALGGACILLAAGLAISNLGLPDTSPVIETLSDADKIRLAEALNLRKQTGESVWPGWGRADIPAIVYNEEYTFIAGYADPPDGWVKVPAGLERGAAWQLVPGDSFLGEPYYRQRLTDPGVTPEAFTVMVGERWVSSMPTLDWFRIGLVHQISEDLPPFLRPVFPYRLFTGQLVSGSDHYISLSAHEAFHSLQGMTAPAKFAEAESASRS
ncbi:MAG TPA: hypothetical protein VFO91_01060, partial [Anaerolineales bacterium]|nr:hypothetical protein [Anaerolineales bacterium]